MSTFDKNYFSREIFTAAGRSTSLSRGEGPGREVPSRYIPYLDSANALEGRLGQVPSPGRELLGGFIPYLDCRGATRISN